MLRDPARTQSDARLSVAGGIAFAGGHLALGPAHCPP